MSFKFRMFVFKQFLMHINEPYITFVSCKVTVLFVWVQLAWGSKEELIKSKNKNKNEVTVSAAVGTTGRLLAIVSHQAKTILVTGWLAG